MTTIKEEIENIEAAIEPVIMKPKRKAKAKQTTIEVNEEVEDEPEIQDIKETPTVEVSQPVNREKAKYMRISQNVKCKREKLIKRT